MKLTHSICTVFLYGLIASATASGTPSRRDGRLTARNDGLLSILSSSANNSSGSSQKASSLVSNTQKAMNKNSHKFGSIQAAKNKTDAIFADGPAGNKNILDLAIKLVTILPGDLLSLLNGYLSLDLNSDSNHNPEPKNNIYPSKDTKDAPYTLSEEDLRAAIYIPDSFSFGNSGKKPVILVPGTAVPAGLTYYFNFGKLENTAPNTEVVWVNIPKASLDDVQLNAEYVAYAINYISGQCGTNVSVISWSQGGLDTQWSLKYWPSTRNVVEDFIAISPDFHGTVMKRLVCPALDLLACTPSLWQQDYESDFIHTLRSDGGDSAYVPTTTLYSSFDEIVEPQSGRKASSILMDSRGVGVTNNHVQTICKNKPAGGIYTHEGMLFNPLSWALAVDALNNDGPGDLSRLNVDDICEQLLPAELGLDDLLGTEGLLLVAVAELLAYLPKAFGEPAIAGYAG